MIRDPEIRHLVAEKASSTPIDAYKSLRYRFEDSGESSDARLRAADFLVRLTKGLIQSLKNLAEAEEIDTYSSALREWTAARGRSEPEARLDDLRFHATHADREAKRRLSREIEELEPVVDAANRISLARASGFIQLGGWLSARFRRDPEHGDWLSYLAPLIPEVGLESVISVLSQHFADHSFDLLSNWHSQEMIASGASTWSGDRSENGLYWAALLLLAKTGPDTKIEVPPSSNASWASTQMQAQLQAVVDDAQLWTEILVANDIDERRSNIESSWNEAEQVQRETERVAIANAQLDPNLVDAFRRGNQEAFAAAQSVSNAFQIMGRRSRIRSQSAFENPGRIVRQVMPKSWFVEDRYVGGLNENIGAEFARDQDEVLFSDLLNRAAPEPRAVGPQLGSLVSAISSLDEEATNRAVVLAPDHYILRERLWEAPGFRPETARRAFGALAGAPVFLIPGAERQPLVERQPLILLDLRHGELSEFVADGQRSPLWIQVATLDLASAAEEVDRGFRFDDEPEMSDEEVANKLASERVLVDALLSWDLKFDPSGIQRFTWDEGELGA